MRIESAEVRVVRMELLTPFETSFGVETHKTMPILTLRCEGVEGYGEGTMDVLPLYREETLAGALVLLRDVLLPAVVGRSITHPDEVATAFAHLRGNRMAKAVVEMAAWDAHARSRGVRLCELLGGERDHVEVGVSLGIANMTETLRRVDDHVSQGYRRIKLKIKPGWDLEPVAAVRAAFPDIMLTVDANSAYTLADRDHLAHLDEHALRYVEQPLAYDDLLDHAELASSIATPICLDESVCSAGDARKAIACGAAGVVNVKLGRVGGHGEARRIHDLALQHGVPVWCGGMLEAGIGRAHNIHAATLPGYTLPGDTSSASRYFARDVTEQKLEATDGVMPVPDGPGIGVTLDMAELDRVTQTRFTVP